MPLDLKRPPRFAPRAPRRAVKMRAVAWLADDRHLPIVITNISQDGFTANTCSAVPQVMSYFGIELPGIGITRAQVRWVDDAQFGSRFDRPLSDDQLSSL